MFFRTKDLSMFYRCVAFICFLPADVLVEMQGHPESSGRASGQKCPHMSPLSQTNNLTTYCSLSLHSGDSADRIESVPKITQTATACVVVAAGTRTRIGLSCA